MRYLSDHCLISSANASKESCTFWRRRTSPVSPATRTLSWIEAITGQFYLAAIVAGLVSLLTAKGKRAGVP